MYTPYIRDITEQNEKRLEREAVWTRLSLPVKILLILPIVIGFFLAAVPAGIAMVVTLVVTGYHK